MPTPHYYQTLAKTAVFDYFKNGGKGNPLVAMPTGSGKSHVIADLLRDIFMTYPGQRVMMLTHVWKLIQQNAAKLYEYWDTAPVGIHSEGLGQRDTMMPIIFGGVQSVSKTLEKNPNAFGWRDLLLIDEAHLLGGDEDSQYLKTIAALKAINPYLKVIGFTATPYRLKMGKLTDGGIFTDIAFDITTHEWFRRLIDEGYLSPLIGKRTNTKIDGLERLRVGLGEVNQTKAEAIVDTEEITYSACKELLDFGHDRQKCMIFAAGIDNAEHINSMMDSFGASFTVVHSKLPKNVVKDRLAAYDNDEYWGIIGANQLTTGYDNPRIDLIGDFQVTKSPGKHVQKYGRGTRVFRGSDTLPPKNNCLVLDFVDNIGSNGPIDDPVMPRKPGQKVGEPPPVKICTTDKLISGEGCDAYNHASVRFCCNCAGEFSFQSKLNHTASNNSPMKEQEEPIIESIKVNTPILYRKNSGKDKGGGIVSPPTVKATYILGLRPVNVFLCFEHTGKARRLAHEWWQRHSANEPPATVDEFLMRTGELRIPKAVTVHSNLKYPTILTYEF